MYSIYEKNPMNFEEETKTKYLLGFLCDKIDNIQYYFSEENIPDNWNDQKKAFFIENKPNNLNASFYECIQNFQYFILDACMSVHKEQKFKDTKVEQLTTLSNLWDPAGTGQVENINDGDEKLNLEFVKEPYNENILNSVMKSNNEISFYDETYDKLLNTCCLEKYGITIKMRLAFENEKYMVAIVINTPEINNQVFILEYGGFSVKVLSLGLHYIETNKLNMDKINNERNKKSLLKLKEIIDFVKKELTNISEKNNSLNTFQITNLLYILLTRFKSTGDHGSAIATKFINVQLQRPTLYLTGDQLAYVYSISQSIPTIFRFFNGKGDNENDNDTTDDDENDNCSSERTHFIGFYSGNTNEIELTIYKYKTLCEFFKEYNLNDDIFIEINDTNNYIMDKNKELKQKITEISNLNMASSDYSTKKIEIENILLTITKRIFINEVILLDGITPEIKIYLNLISELRNYFFILKNIDIFKTELQKQLKLQVEDYTNIIKINTDEIFNEPNINKRRSLREQIVQFTNFGIKDFYNNLKNATFKQFVDQLNNTVIDDKTTFLDKIIEIKKNMKKRYKQIETFVESELSLSATSLKEIIKDIFDVYKNKLIEKTKNTKDENVKNHFVSLIFDKSIGELEKEKTTTNVSALKTTEPKKGFLSKTIKKISTAFSNVKKTVKNITKKNKK
jgi:hypothetical protein